MSSVEYAFRYMIEQVNEMADEEPEDVQVGLRVDMRVVAGLDALAKILRISRAGVAREIVTSGIEDALRAAGLETWHQSDPEGGAGKWQVIPAGKQGPEGARRMTSDTGE